MCVGLSRFDTLKYIVLCSVQVANELGRGNAKAAKFSIKVLLGTSIAIGLFFFLLCLIFGRKLAYAFTTDERVADTVSDLSLLLSFSVLLNSIYPVLSGNYCDPFLGLVLFQTGQIRKFRQNEMGKRVQVC